MKLTLEEVCYGMLDYWLRHGHGPSADALAAYLKVDTKHVRAVIKATRGGKLEDSALPGFETVLGNRHYHQPVTWVPTLAHLRAELRGEGRCEHNWLVKATLMPLGSFTYTVTREYKVVTRTHKMALETARDLAAKEFSKGVHANSSFEVEWLGKNIPAIAKAPTMSELEDRAEEEGAGRGTPS